MKFHDKHSIRGDIPRVSSSVTNNAYFLMLQIVLQNWFSASFQYHEEWPRQLLGLCWDAGSQVLTSIPYRASFQPRTAASPKGRGVARAGRSAQEQPLAHRPHALLQHLGCPSPQGSVHLSQGSAPGWCHSSCRAPSTACASSQVTPGVTPPPSSSLLARPPGPTSPRRSHRGSRGSR